MISEFKQRFELIAISTTSKIAGWPELATRDSHASVNF
jgi:hypothetical protein